MVVQERERLVFILTVEVKEEEEEEKDDEEEE
jgi:hypothetical protein